MLINEYVAMELHKRRQDEIEAKAHGNRTLAEIIAEFKTNLNSERKNRRSE
ncbi:MAG: hypothetical protein OHK0046_12260 [Anaerolineae bacterium]